MNETRYTISEAVKITQVEAHVLRYWEEELKLLIGRNEMGHRYYTEKDIQTFQNIKELKKKGLQLRAIREMVHCEEIQENKVKVQRQEEKEEVPRVIVVKPQRFQPTKKEQVEDKKTKEERFGEIMERLIREVSRSERKEGRYRRLDEAIRRHQQSRKMVAATEENVKKKGRGENKKK